MYLNTLNLKNIGPLENINHTFSFNEAFPKCTIFVGTNGSGKSIIISHVVSAILELQGALFENAEIDSGKVYKVRSPLYIKHGETFFSSEVNFSNGFYTAEIQLDNKKSDYVAKYESLPSINYVSEIPESHSSLHKSNAL